MARPHMKGLMCLDGKGWTDAFVYLNRQGMYIQHPQVGTAPPSRDSHTEVGTARPRVKECVTITLV